MRIIRVAGSSFGKSSRWRRTLDFGAFLLACTWHLLRMPRFDAIIAMTSPPLVVVLAVLAAWLKGGAVYAWLMDLNPDEAVAAGWLRETSLPARFLECLHRLSLRRCAGVVVLDRFMQARIAAKGIPPERITIVPPWSHEVAQWDPAGRAAFRRRHRLDEKFVVMYSGNHSPCHPLDSLLNAARVLRQHPEIAFCFIGGGSEFAKVQAFSERHGLKNLLTLPYQPLDRLSESFSSADLQVVVMGDPFVGIVHPCKIYNVMTLGTPVLYIGPAESHIGDLDGADWLHSARHGDLAGIVQHILSAANGAPRRYAAERVVAAQFAAQRQLPRLLDVISGRAVPGQVVGLPQGDRCCLS